MVTKTNGNGRTRRATAFSHIHSWLIGRPDGQLSEGVCRSCGARRDFVAGIKRSLNGSPRPLQAQAGVWLEITKNGKGRGIKMANLVDEEEREAQRIALAHLIRGCDDAVSGLIQKGKGQQLQSTKRAREILAEMLSSWRQTLTALARTDANGR